MILICEKCFAKYSVDSSLIGAAGRVVKCTSCGHNWKQFLPEEAGKPQEKPEPIVKTAMVKTEEPKTSSFKYVLAAMFILMLCIPPALIFFMKDLTENNLVYKIYSEVGLFKTDGVELQNLEFKKFEDPETKKLILLVKGQVVNTTDERRKVPKIIIKLYDSNNKQMTSLEYKAPKERLKAGETIPFEPKINNVPDEVTKIVVDMGNFLELAVR